jgi:hypothetical protein
VETRSPSVVTKKSRLPKHTCAPKVQLTPWLAIHGLMWTKKHTKAPTGCANYWCFEPPTSKFIFTRLVQMVCLEDTRIYTGSG